MTHIFQWDDPTEVDKLGGTFDFEAGMRWVDVEFGSAYPADGDEVREEYLVELPHQCDGWTIVATGDLDEAIDRMDTFVDEASWALQKLKEIKEYRP